MFMNRKDLILIDSYWIGKMEDSNNQQIKHFFHELSNESLWIFCFVARKQIPILVEISAPNEEKLLIVHENMCLNPVRNSKTSL